MITYMMVLLLLKYTNGMKITIDEVLINFVEMAGGVASARPLPLTVSRSAAIS